MSFFTNLVRSAPKKTRTAILIDVHEKSVSGACAYAIEGELPTILYAQRVPISPHAKQQREQAAVYALHTLTEHLIREGAPTVARAAGSGSANDILLSVGAPWQKTVIRTEAIERGGAFTFTPEIVSERLKETAIDMPGKLLVNESIIGTILNGYETRDPYGEEARRAAIIALSSFVDEAAARDMRTVLTEAYHTDGVLAIASESLRTQAMHEAFPHERDMLIVDAGGPTAAIALVRRGLLTALEEIPHAPSDAAWTAHALERLAELGKTYPLPRTIFLLSGEIEAVVLRRMVEKAHRDGLWLSDGAPKTVLVRPDHLTGLVRHATESTPNLSLLLMALFWRSNVAEM